MKSFYFRLLELRASFISLKDELISIGLFMEITGDTHASLARVLIQG